MENRAGMVRGGIVCAVRVLNFSTFGGSQYHISNREYLTLPHVF